MIPLCRYILQGGNQCQQAAINGEYYCRHHLVVRRTVAAATPKPNPYRIEQPLPLVFPEDRAALQLDVFIVMQAFNEGTIGPKSANILTRLLHECSINLKQGPLYETDRDHAVRRVVVTPEGEEIAPAREVPESGDASSQDSAQDNEASGEDALSQEPPIGSAQTTGNADALDPYAITCNDPCYIANLTERREQYREFALKDLAAGRDPRDWDDFIPGISRSRRPAPIPSLKS